MDTKKNDCGYGGCVGWNAILCLASSTRYVTMGDRRAKGVPLSSKAIWCEGKKFIKLVHLNGVCLRCKEKSRTWNFSFWDWAPHLECQIVKNSAEIKRWNMLSLYKFIRLVNLWWIVVYFNHLSGVCIVNI